MLGATRRDQQYHVVHVQPLQATANADGVRALKCTVRTE